MTDSKCGKQSEPTADAVMTDDKLKDIEEKATSIRYKTWEPCGCRFSVVTCHEYSDQEPFDICDVGNGGAMAIEEVSQYVSYIAAANPKTILSLISELRAEREKVKRLEKAVEVMRKWIESTRLQVVELEIPDKCEAEEFSESVDFLFSELGAILRGEGCDVDV